MSRGAVNRYNAKTYDMISVRVRKDLAQRFRAKTAEEGISQASVITDAIREFLSKKKSPSS